MVIKSCTGTETTDLVGDDGIYASKLKQVMAGWFGSTAVLYSILSAKT
jgi:hypothetical protein